MGNKHAIIITPPSRDPGTGLDRPDKPGLATTQPTVSPRPPRPVSAALRKPQARRPLADEAELIEKIQKTPSKEFISRYEQLAAMQDSEQLSEAEAQELLGLSDQLEGMAVERLEALAELARIRGIPLRLLAQEMGIKPIVNA